MPFLNSGIQIVFFYVEYFKTCFDEVIPSVKDWQGKGCACDLAEGSFRNVLRGELFCPYGELFCPRGVLWGVPKREFSDRPIPIGRQIC